MLTYTYDVTYRVQVVGKVGPEQAANIAIRALEEELPVPSDKLRITRAFTRIRRVEELCDDA